MKIKKKIPAGLVTDRESGGTKLAETNKEPNDSQTAARRSRPISYKNKRPLLRGFLVGSMVYVHCPWCDGIHAHGWNPEDNARVVNGRYSHCYSPGAPGNYWISVFRKSSLAIIERDRREAEIRKLLREMCADTLPGDKTRQNGHVEGASTELRQGGF